MTQPRVVSMVSGSALILGLALAALPVVADDRDDDDGHHKHSQATASFGRGLNTAQPGNAVNHAVLPKELKIKAGGVVDFAVAGFHDVVIFKPGLTFIT